jgi:hypothetical protein
VAGVIVVQGASLVNEVLVPIYAELGLDMDPSLTGAIQDVAEVDIEEVGTRFAEQFANDGTRQCSEIDSDTMALARSFQTDHDPRILA